MHKTSSMNMESWAPLRDGSDNRLRAALLEGQRRVLEQVAIGAPLDLILQTLVRLVEEQSGDMRCAVLLADAAQTQLRFVAAPNIPKDYQLGMQPYLRIAPDMGSCGTAAFLRQPVYTRDTSTSPLWKSCGHVAVRNGFRAVWSTPILSDANIVLGTFAMYYGETRLPSDEHEQLINMAVQLARVAIESKHDDDILNAVFEGVPGGVLVTDLVGSILRVNHAFARMLGFTPDELHRRSIADIGDAKDNAASIEELLSLEEPEIVNNRRYRAKSGAPVWVRARTGVRRDAAGVPRYMLTRVERVLAEGSDPLDRLSRREREVLDLVIAGCTSKEIATRLAIAAPSVDTYRSRIMQKLGIDDLPSLVRFAIRQGIADV